MKTIRYIFVLAASLVCTMTYGVPYPQYRMRSTSPLLQAMDKQSAEKRPYGMYPTSVPRSLYAPYTRKGLTPGNTLPAAAQYPTKSSGSPVRRINLNAGGFEPVGVRSLLDNGMVASPQQFSMLSGDGITVLNGTAETNPTGSGAGTPSIVAYETDPNALPVGDGTMYLMLLAGAWLLLLRVRKTIFNL